MKRKQDFLENIGESASGWKKRKALKDIRKNLEIASNGKQCIQEKGQPKAKANYNTAQTQRKTPSWLKRERNVSTSKWIKLSKRCSLTGNRGLVVEDTQHPVSTLSCDLNRLASSTNWMESFHDEPLDHPDYSSASEDNSDYESYIDENFDYVDPLVFSNRDAQYQLSIGLINPDNMTYEQLLELGEKIGSVKSVFSKGLVNSHSTTRHLKKENLIRLQNLGQDICLICLENFTEGSCVRELRCGHQFHSPGCIDTWLDSSKLCPSCKTEVCPEGEGVVGSSKSQKKKRRRRRRKAPLSSPQK